MKPVSAQVTRWAAALACLLASPAALADTPSQSPHYVHGKAHWVAGEWRDAYEELVLHRKEPYGRRVEVDYMLATSACRISELRAWGAATLARIPYAYPISPKARTVVAAEGVQCSTVAALAATGLPPDAPQIAAGMEAVGKLFYWADRAVPVNSYPARRKREISSDELSRRIVPRTEAATVESKARERLGALGLGAMKTSASSHFVIVTRGSQTAVGLEKIAAQLETYLGFLERRYGVADPSAFVSVYLAPNVAELRKIAEDLHGLDVSPATIGYTFADDLSVVGVVPGEQIGTLFHELFHLMARASFGDIPFWLDEGIAALYEVSTLRCGEAVGEPNWRGRVLKDLWSLRPSLEQLVTTQWFLPDLPAQYTEDSQHELSVERQAAIAATGRYFALMLQETDRLTPMYVAFRDHVWGSDDLSQEIKSIAEKALGESLGDADQHFADWFQQVNKAGSIPRPAPACGESGESISKPEPPAPPP